MFLTVTDPVLTIDFSLSSAITSVAVLPYSKILNYLTIFGVHFVYHKSSYYYENIKIIKRKKQRLKNTPLNMYNTTRTICSQVTNLIKQILYFFFSLNKTKLYCHIKTGY